MGEWALLSPTLCGEDRLSGAVLLTATAQRTCVIKKSNEPFTFNKFCSTPPHSTFFACVCGEMKRELRWLLLSTGLN